MKPLFTVTLLVLLSLCAAAVYGQQANKSDLSKPFLFNKYPAVIYCTGTQLSTFFNFTEGQYASVSFNNNLTLAGTVKSNEGKYANLQTVILNLAAFNNTLFMLSKRTDQHNNIVYVGHVLNNAFADGYEIKKTGVDDYQLVKIDMEKILPYCKQ